MISSTNQNINPKSCLYNCGTMIYWNTSENAYFEVFAKKKHVCPIRTSNGKSVIQSTTTNNTVAKPNYYNKFAKQAKQKMSNSFKLLTGPVSEIQKKYEILSDIVSEANGKVHAEGNNIVLLCLLVFYITF